MKTSELATLAIWLLVSMPAAGLANQATTQDGPIAPCAVLEAFSGNAQILDATRTRIFDAEPKKAVSCGGWVSVDQGWVSLRHRFGYQIHIGPGSFVQFLDGEDALLLFRGQVFAQAGGGMGELRVLTPNARAKVTRGSIVALFDPDEGSTQLIAVDGKSHFSNRFEESPQASTWVRAGESSQLNFRLVRVIPSVPKGVATSSLRAKLHELHVPERATQRALAVAHHRQKQVFVSAEEAKKPLPILPVRHAADGAKSSRAPASEPAHGSSAAPGRGEHFDSQSYLELKTVGGSPEGVKLLRHGKAAVKAQKAKVRVEDPEAALIQRQKSQEDAERQRLIEELSHIRSD